jgi:hypothetical protein
METSRDWPVSWDNCLLRKSLMRGVKVSTNIPRYPNTSLWITEYAFSHQALAPSQEFFKMSAEYFDRMESVERYSYFGSFRSDISNVGANAAMLDAKGQLTDIGAWYLGRAATGNIPSAAVHVTVQFGVMAMAFMMSVFVFVM